MLVTIECDANRVRSYLCQSVFRLDGENSVMKQVVEYQGIPVGVLIPSDGCLAFLAVKYDVMELDGRRFSSVAEARDAIRAHVTQRVALVA